MKKLNRKFKLILVMAATATTLVFAPGCGSDDETTQNGSQTSTVVNSPNGCPQGQYQQFVNGRAQCVPFQSGQTGQCGTQGNWYNGACVPNATCPSGYPQAPGGCYHPNTTNYYAYLRLSYCGYYYSTYGMVPYCVYQWVYGAVPGAYQNSGIGWYDPRINYYRR